MVVSWKGKPEISFSILAGFVPKLHLRGRIC